MTEISEKDRAFGARVAKLRKQRKLTQKELATLLSRTVSWMSQVERGAQKVVRLDMLQQMADALGVSVQALNPSVPIPTVSVPARLEHPNDLDDARLLLSGHPAPGAFLAGGAEAPDVSVDELAARVDEVWELTHDAHFGEMNAAVTELLPLLETAVRTVPEDQRATTYSLLARTYQALSAAFVRQDEADAAWVAADRAVNASELSGDPLQACASVYRMVHAFVRMRRLDQAERAASTAVEALTQRDQQQGLAPEGLSVLGALHLVLALVCARSGQRAEAREEIGKARQIATRIGEDRNDFNLEFGPTNVEIQAVSTAVDLGDAGEALDIGLAIDADQLSPERRGRLLMDLGRAHAQRRHTGEALDCLLRAESLSPDTVRTHIAVREAIRELVLVAGRSAPPELMQLAERADALE
jgi:transcriptional regulator with XRE-family HTH domain